MPGGRKRRRTDDVPRAPLFKLMETVDEIKEAGGVNDHDYLRICNALKEVHAEVHPAPPSPTDGDVDDASGLEWSDNAWRTAHDIRVRRLKRLYNRLLDYDRDKLRIIQNQLQTGASLLDKLCALRLPNASVLELSEHALNTLKACMDISVLDKNPLTPFLLD